MASIILVLNIQTHKKTMYSIEACVKLQKKNPSSGVDNQNSEHMYMDKLTSMWFERIHTMTGLNDRQL